MKQLIYIVCIIFFATACAKENKEDNLFQDYVNKIPDLRLPFNANSYVDLESKVEITDSLYKDFFVESQEIYGKIKINDSITGIIYLYPGDIVFPELVTYNKKGQIISQQQLVTLMGGSGSIDSNGSSYMNLTTDFKIHITDTIQTFERDSVGMMIDSTLEVEVVNYKYNIGPNGNITEIK